MKTKILTDKMILEVLEKNKEIKPLLTTDYFSRFISLVNFEYCPFAIKYLRNFRNLLHFQNRK